MRKVLYKFSEVHLEDYLSEVSDRSERAKIKMTFWFSGVMGFFMLFMLPILKDISTSVFIFGCLGVLILLGNLIVLKRYKVYKPNARTILAILILLDMFSLNIVLPSNPTPYIIGAVLLIMLATFVLCEKWTISFSLITVLGFIPYTFMKVNGWASGALAPSWVFISDDPAIDATFPLKLAVVLAIISYVLIKFNGINRETQEELEESLKVQTRLNRELKFKEAKYRRLVESVGDMVYEINSKGKFSYMNPTCTKMLGYTLEDLQPRTYLYLIAEDYQKELEVIFNNQIRRKTTVFHYQYPVVTKSGEEIWIGQTASLFYDNSGKFVNAFCVGRDVSNYRASRKMLLEAKEKAEEASTLKTKFLSAMSHEIRTPINAIVGNVHLLQDENPEPRFADRLGVLKFSADNLMALVSNILDFENLEAGNMKLKNEVFNLTNSMSYLKMGFEKSVYEKSIDFTLEIDSKLPSLIYGDSLRLTQILNNLVQNAIKFTNEGSVKIALKENLRTDKIVQIYFAVIDTGIGISEAHQSTIFEEFSQANTDTIREGAGLGLAISKKMATLMGTEIKVKSTLGKGSEFSFVVEFKIPEKEIELQQAKMNLTKKKTTQSLIGKNILLVEDNLINQKVTGSFLKKWGAEFAIAKNGLVAVQMVEENDYDLILMDLQMPVMDGVEATKIIRAMGGHYQTMPIVALTASAVLEIKKYAMKSGLTDFLTKPFTPVDLNQIIFEHIAIGESANEDLVLENYGSRGV